ncbi:MAG: hypothetical protein JSR91_23355 [Proteobacteria bacterium]|nr:hypothetical protein [Pseudomonadota bacterium]
MFEIVVEPNARRRRPRRALSQKKRAATLFRIWHGMRELLDEAEQLGESELVHFLAVAQMLVEEKAATISVGAAFEGIETGLPN